MAATDLERLVVQLSADIRKYENALSRAQGQTNRRARAIQSRFDQMNKSISAGLGGISATATRAFAAIGGAAGAKTLLDTATSIDNALKVAGLSGAELERVYEGLFAAATKNAAPIETLVQLYGRLSLVQNELGISQQQIVGFASNIALALRVGGTSAQEASGALLQLSQALGGGVVRAEEFNSILEGAPTILQAAASGIKEAEGSVAKLRKIMLDGNLSSKALFDGFQAGAPILEQKVAGAVLTIDQRLSNLRTALVNAAREFNQSAKAGETFGNEVDRISSFLNAIDWDGVIGEIQKIAEQFRGATSAVSGFLSEFGRFSALEGVGRKFVDLLPGEGASKSYFGGALTITSTAAVTDRINQAFESEIQKAGELTSEAIRNSVLGTGPGGKGGRVQQNLPALGPVPGARPQQVKPISLKDYPVDDDGGGKSKSKRKGGNDYERETEQIRQRTAALQAETAAQAQINPLVDDYGFAIEKARATQELLNAAQEAGVKITPQLKAQIEQLATGYANAVVASEQLAEKQDEIRRRAEDAMGAAKDVTRGVIDGFLEGASAADVLRDSLKRIGDALITDVLDNIFKINDASGGGGFLGSLFGSVFGGFKGVNYFPPAPGKMYSDGGYTGPGGKYQPAGIVHKGEYVFDAEATRRIGVDNLRRLQGYAQGGLVGAPRMPALQSRAAATTVSLTYAPQIDNRGASVEAVARLEQSMARDRATFEARVVNAVSDANARGVRMNGSR
ncbi:tape measure protein [Rhizobium sp. LCM 4573]|uniref:tape measure protein n=1 Tax=Rhizobium sp. LCM 4573 TaxID=1848291 RepID=UPI0008DB0203|nr:tape measure protein [Rhizobium sp. LCM 4573]OHV84154.1 hypothetical protein LCM4573_00110 [Rhizobium sp. LCM 4573]